MGKIALSSKKSDDLVKPALIRESLTKPPKDVKSPVTLSPTPKNPLSNKKSGVCRRLFLFCLGILVILLLFSTAACILDYRVANLGTRGRELREFPKEVGKYMLDVLYQTPRGLHGLFTSAASQIQSWTAKTEDISPRLKVWEEMREGKKLKSMEEAEGLVSFQQKHVETNEIDHVEDVNEESLKVKSGQFSSKVVDDDASVDDGFQVAAGFILNMFTDIASIFTGSEVNKNEADERSTKNFMIETNEFPRATFWEKSDDKADRINGMLSDRTDISTEDDEWDWEEIEEVNVPEEGKISKEDDLDDVSEKEIKYNSFITEDMKDSVESTSDFSVFDQRKHHRHQ